MSRSKDSLLIVSFAGHGRHFGTLPRYEFVNFLNKHYKDASTLFFLDKHMTWYHDGIDDITTDMDGTIAYLRDKIQNYDTVVFIGSSAGGYAAVLFGALLDVSKVIVFKPQTMLPLGALQMANRDSPYKDLRIVLESAGKKTQFHVYGDLDIGTNDSYHHISQCKNIECFPNVHVSALHGLDLQKMRDSGALLSIFSKIIPLKGSIE